MKNSPMNSFSNESRPGRICNGKIFNYEVRLLLVMGSFRLFISSLYFANYLVDLYV